MWCAGGPLLLTLELIRRTTIKDVEVLASLEDGRLVTARPLQEWLFTAVTTAKPNHGVIGDPKLFQLGTTQSLLGRATD